MSKTKNRSVVRGACAGLCLLAALSARGEQSHDDFTAGLSPCWWESRNNQPLYQVMPTNGGVTLSKPVGGDFGFQWVDLRFLRELHGDFDVSAQFTDASIHHATGGPGNQIQLNVFMGTSVFAVVRSDENGLGGENAHVWAVPPAIIGGSPMMTAASNGILRVARRGDVVSGYFNGTQLWAEALGPDPAWLLSFSLQNNGTRDATRVTLDAFSVEAQDIRPFACRVGAIEATPEATFQLVITNLTPLLTNTLQVSDGWATDRWMNLQDVVVSNMWASGAFSVAPEGPVRFYRVVSRDP
ncbi:MAG: hypothetical protein K8T26_05940 [Lentisphaerae bacterium]|nr:hypothetical protein [Lentisphaerota bacterium]